MAVDIHKPKGRHVIETPAHNYAQKVSKAGSIAYSKNTPHKTISVKEVHGLKARRRKY